MTQETTWHRVIVERVIKWEDGPEGGAVLLVPRFRWGPLARWLQPRLKRPYIRVKLDEMGSFCWRMFDGKTPFDDIVAAMEAKFGPKATPGGERLKKFLAILHKNKFANLYEHRKGIQSNK